MVTHQSHIGMNISPRGRIWPYILYLVAKLQMLTVLWHHIPPPHHWWSYPCSS